MNLWQNTINNSYASLAVKRVRYPKIAGSTVNLLTKNTSYLNFVSNDYLGLSQNGTVENENYA